MDIALNTQGPGNLGLDFEQIAANIMWPLGIKLAEYWPKNHDITKGEMDPYGPDLDLTRTRKIARKYGIAFAAVNGPFSFEPKHNEKPDQYSRYMLEVVELAHQLDAKVINTYLNMFAYDKEPDISLIMKYIGAALKKAQGYDITICVEVEAHDMTSRLEWSLDILKKIGQANLKYTFDGTNWWHGSVDPIKALTTLGEADCIGYLHIKDAVKWTGDYDMRRVYSDIPRGNPGDLICGCKIGTGATQSFAQLQKVAKLQSRGKLAGIKSATIEPHLNAGKALMQGPMGAAALNAVCIAEDHSALAGYFANK